MSTFDDFIYENEERDGIRFSWNIWPSNKNEANDMIVPLGCIYTPLKEKANHPKLNYPPILCSKPNCGTVLNPFCFKDFNSRSWNCNFCGTKNYFPKHYEGINENYQPAELLPNFTTIDYLIAKPDKTPLVILYIIDICVDEIELTTIKNSIKKSLKTLPEATFVGLIAFGKNVYIYDLNENLLTTCYTFNGSKDVNLELIKQALKSSIGNEMQTSQSLNPQRNPGPYLPKQNSIEINNKFVQPLYQCELRFNAILSDLQADPWPLLTAQRPLRATGVALSLGVQILEECLPKSIGRIMLFVGGPCTYGPGIIIDSDLKKVIRSFHDIATDNNPYMLKSWKFYTDIAKKAANSHAIDIFSCCLDQTGLLEMRNCSFLTGGSVIMSDAFNTTIFKESFAKIFEKKPVPGVDEPIIPMFLNAMLEIRMSKELKVNGCIGHCIGLGIKKDYVSSKEIGIGATSVWKMCSIDSKSTYAFVLEHTSNNVQGQQGFIQFVTSYMDILGQKHIRVTTCSRQWNSGSFNNSPKNVLSFGFDQDASAILMARISAYRCINDDNVGDVLRWIDRTLIKLCQFTAEFSQNNPASFKLPQNMILYPQYIYHLRRSQFLQCFNNSPDETTFYRYYLLKEDVIHGCLMIQPVLYSYRMDSPNFSPKPVLLDSDSIQADNILFLDTFFHVLIHLGKAIEDWKKKGFHNDPNYLAFSQFLQLAEKDALEVVANRFPIPRYIYTTQGASQARFLLSKVNPSQTYNSSQSALNYYNQNGSNQTQSVEVFTDDISLDAFMEHLKKLVTSVN